MIDSKTSEETGVGNYFISNYPQYSFWKPDFVSDVHDVLNSPSPSNPLPLGIYFHIPFCRKRCHFCYFRVYTDKKASEIKAYIDSGIKEIIFIISKKKKIIKKYFHNDKFYKKIIL